MNNKQDAFLLIGLMLQELGGEFKISPNSQLEFSKDMVNKELLMMEDPATNEITIKLVNKKDIENPLDYMNKSELKEK